MKDDEKSRNWVIGKSSNDERLFEENRRNIKFKKGNRVYTIYGGGLKIRNRSKSLYKPSFYASPRSGDVRLVTIYILCLILPPRHNQTPKNFKLRPKPILFLMIT